MKNNHFPDLENEADDAVWDLLAQAPPQPASPTFTQDVLRARRLSEEEKGFSWKALFTSPALALPVCAALVLFGIILFKPASVEKSPVVAETVIIQANEVEEDTWLDEALLATALEEPELFTDEELVAMIF